VGWASIAKLFALGLTTTQPKGLAPSSKSKSLMRLLLSRISSAQGVRCGASGRGAGAVLKDKNTYKLLSVNQGTPLLSDGSVTANNKGKTMETSTGELIAKLTNLSHNLALELRFKESSLVLEAVGALHALPNIAETIRDSWHPSLNTSGPSKGLNYLSTVKLAEDE
jgi:hypothetical protein